jgi:hypothetical protein
MLDNITGFASTGFLTRTGAGTYAFQSTTNGITNSNLAQASSWTLKGNPSGSTANVADFTVDSLTAKASPTTSDEILIWDIAGSAMKKATIGSLPAGAVSSVTGNGVTITSTGTIPPPYGIVNHSLAVSASAGALTIALKDSAGSDPSAASPVNGYFRNVTTTTGSWTQLTVTAALSVTINSGATMGVTSSTAFRLWVVLFNDGGTARLGVVNCSDASTIYPLNESAVASSTAVSGSSNSAGVIYTGVAVTSKAFLIVGYVEWSSSGLTAGTWTTTNVLYVQSFGPGVRKPGEAVQSAVFTTTSSTATTSSTYTATNLLKAITPTSATNLMRVSASYQILSTASATVGVAQIGRNSNSNMFGSLGVANSSSGAIYSGPGSIGWDKPNSTSSTTYTLYLKSSDNTSSVTAMPNSYQGLIEVTEIMG